jgi:hypothetical protein
MCPHTAIYVSSYCYVRRVLLAATDIQVGEVVLREKPLMCWPTGVPSKIDYYQVSLSVPLFLCVCVSVAVAVAVAVCVTVCVCVFELNSFPPSYPRARTHRAYSRRTNRRQRVREQVRVCVRVCLSV